SRHQAGARSGGRSVLRRLALCSAAVAGLNLALLPTLAEAGAHCAAPAALARFDAPLPRFAAALASGQPVNIVALGSSGTQGIGASSPAACYPVKLQAELLQRFPQNRIVVENLGIGGQLATDMLARIKTDVIPRQPTLVIWQTGVNDAMRGVKVEEFRQTVI